MLTNQVFNDLRLIVNWVFTSLLSPLWTIVTGTILAFIVISWLVGNLVRWFKRFL